MVSCNHSNINLGSSLVLSSKLFAVSDYTKLSVNKILAAFSFHSKGTKINQVLLDLLSKFIRLLRMFNYKGVQICFFDVFKRVRDDLLASRCHIKDTFIKNAFLCIFNEMYRRFLCIQCFRTEINDSFWSSLDRNSDLLRVPRYFSNDQPPHQFLVKW